MSESLIPSERIEQSILLIRGHKVIIDADLARLYGVTTKRLNQAIRRNIARFPSDFIFKLTEEEKHELVTNCDQFNKLKHSSSLPYAFTEHGVAMLSSVLRSKRAIQVNIEIMRAFAHLRQMLASHADLSRRLDELERRYDHQFKTVFDAIRELMTPPTRPQRKIGFVVEGK